MMNQKNAKPGASAAASAEQIALFRFGIIAPVLHNSGIKQTRYFKQMAQNVHDVPGYGRRKYSWKTFKEWLRLYRQRGFEALKPRTRIDKGTSRSVDDYLATLIRQKLVEFPDIKVAALYRILAEQGLLQAGSPSEAAVRKFILNNDLSPKLPKPKPRKKFEKPHINDLWLSDFMHGQQFKIDGIKRKLFLCGIIDDHSRLLVGCRWTLKENTEALELVLKDALATYGLPKLFYCDNGAVYTSAHLQLVCARLGVALVHSKPYDSPSRGKIERFWRTVREGFLPLVPRNTDYSLDGFNQRFDEWLNQHYHRRFHHGILQTPLERFLQGQKNLPIRRVTETELEQYFYSTYRRRVKNDATVSVNATLFEVPAKYIGTYVELRHPTGQPLELGLYENQQPKFKLQKVNLVENSQSAHHGIHFAKKLTKED
jgi:transposase InsO family protein